MTSQHFNGLREIGLKSVYRSESDNLFSDFYLPCLRVAVRYDRSVGYFSAAMFSHAAQGLTALFEGKGAMRLIFGAALSEQDIEDIKQGYRIREVQSYLGKQIVEELVSVEDDLYAQRVATVARLIANGNLDVKVAVTRNGIYHEKIGVIYDSAGDSVVFSGSANESRHALLPDFNFEAISVYPSWRPELGDFYKEYRKGFTQLWDSESKKAVVLPFPEAAKKQLINIASRAPSVSVAIEADLWRKAGAVDLTDINDLSSGPAVPETYKGAKFRVRGHQREALNRWQAQDYRGILSLATGAGKTVTSLYAAVRMFETKRRLVVIISVPYVNLAEQWREELAAFGVAPVMCYGSWTEWYEQLQQLRSLYNRGTRSFLCLVVVNATLKSERFQSLIRDIEGRYMLFIGDECHHHGTKEAAAGLPEHAEFRIGLSATPFDYLDSEKNVRIEQYYGPVAFEYGIREALNDGVLASYEYYVEVVELTDEEADEYRELAGEIGRLIAASGDGSSAGESEERLQRLLMRRSRLLGSCRNKSQALRELLEGRAPERFSLFYCGDGSVADDISDAVSRQVDVVSGILGELGWKSSQFTARENKKERASILSDFRIGAIDSLIAIRCLDEGVDIPACHSAYMLASARNPRQFVQRRGRVLRPSPGKDEAHIYDFVVRIPPGGGSDERLERNLVKKELERVAEFASLANNFAEAESSVRPLLDEYSLTHMLIKD